MDRRPEELPELGELSDDALNQLGEGIPSAWLDVATGGGDRGGLHGLAEAEAGASLDPEQLRELLAGLDSEAEERVADQVVDGFLGGGGGVGLGGPSFVDDEGPRADVIPIQGAVSPGSGPRSAERSWWGFALPLAAAAIVLIVLVDGPGLGAVFDDEGRVRPAELSPNATASAERKESRAKWSLGEAPVPGSVPGASAGEASEEEEATISVPGGVPGRAKGGVQGGVVGGAVGGALGGVGVPGGSAPGDKGEPAGVSGGVGGSAQAPGSTKQGAGQRPVKVMPIVGVMAHSLYAPDPDPKALASTKAGMFDRRPCTSRIRFCVDPRGRTVDVRSVGACYDPKVNQICRETVKKWRFKPFIVAGAASPVCTEVSFDLRFDKRR